MNEFCSLINFSNNEDHISISEFIEGLKDVNWASQVASSIDNFEGEGNSIDYDKEDFESFEEGDSDGCDYDASTDPTSISFYFGDEKIEFNLIDENLYEFKDVKYSKKDIIELVKHFNK